MKTLLTILGIVISLLTFGQSKADQELIQFLKVNSIDTFVFVKTGCSKCTTSYEDSSNYTDTTTIRMLFQHKGQERIMVFSDTSLPKVYTKPRSDIFDFILNRKHLLEKKVRYDQDDKLLKFHPPCFTKYPYEAVEIKIGQLRYQHTSVERAMDVCGGFLTNEDWFAFEVDLLKQLDELLY